MDQVGLISFNLGLDILYFPDFTGVKFCGVGHGTIILKSEQGFTSLQQEIYFPGFSKDRLIS